MKAKYTLVLISLVFITLRTEAQTYWSDSTLKKILVTEFEEFRDLAVYNRVPWDSIVFTTKKQSHVAFESKVIVVNISQLRPYLQRQSNEFVQIFIDYFLAHEFSHKFQYNFFIRDVFKKLNADNRIYLECHADMIAPIFYKYIQTRRDFAGLQNVDEKKSAELFQKRYLLAQQVYSALFDMDKANVNVTSHPTHDQRLLALTEGEILASSYSWLSYDSSKNKINDFDERLRLRTMESVKAIGYNPFKNDSSANPFIWAAKEAARIIHHNNRLANNMVIFDRKVNWRSKPQPPLVWEPNVEYSFQVYNGNSVNVSFSGHVYTHCVDTSLEKKPLEIKVVDGSFFDIVVKPGATATINGVINWASPNVGCNPNEMPHIVFPGERHSVYSVFEENRPVHDSVQWDSFHFEVENWNKGTTEDLIDLVYYVLQKDNTLRNQLRGIGTSPAVNFAELPLAPKYFQSLFNAGNPNDQYICLTTAGETIFWVNLFDSKDSLEIVKNYFETVNQVKSYFSEFSLESSGAVSDFRNVDREIRLATYYDQGLKRYCLSLYVKKKTL